MQGKQIVVLERGFVYVGDVSREGDIITINNARNIRRWGTTAGLGQLAKQGPQAATKLDDAGVVTAHIGSVIHTIACTSEVWA